MALIDHRTYKPPTGEDPNAFFSKLTPGTAVAEQPGQTWQHTGQGWEWQGAGGASGGSGSEAPPPGTTQGGVKPPSALPPSGGLTVTGGAGTSSLTPGPDSSITGQAPAVPVGDPNVTSYDTLMRQRLLQLLGTDPTKASITDADLAPQADAYAAAREKARREQQANNATRMGAVGLSSSGAADNARNAGYEAAGQDTAAFNANLVGQKLQQRQQTLEQAIQSAQSLGMTEEAHQLQQQLANLSAQMQTMQLGQGAQGQALQRQVANLDNASKTYLANLDADLRRQGFSTSERLATMDAELRRYGIDVQGNLGLLNAIIQMTGQGQQNQQFYDSLGAQLGMFGATLNQNLINNLTGG